MENGTIINPINGRSVSLGDIYFKLFSASGDMRANGDAYLYEIQLSSLTSPTHPGCSGASVCQVKPNDQRFSRKVGTSERTKYYVQDGDLDVVFTSSSKCGKDKSKSVSSTIFFHCDPLVQDGVPEFSHETADCQYLFSWYTSAVCPLSDFDSENTEQDEQEHRGLSERSQAVGALLSLLLVALTGCLLTLLLYKKERRETVMNKLTSCCRRSSSVSYKYSKVNKEEETENETEWLMEEIQLPAPRPGKEGQENGHVTTKAVRAEALSSLHGDEQDSEDEVLTIPELKVAPGRGAAPDGSQPGRLPQRKVPRGREDDRVGLVPGEKLRKGKARPVPPKPTTATATAAAAAQLASFHDDSDEDLLHI